MENIPIIVVPDDEAREIVATCQRFKQAVIAHARSKKRVMARCYAYAKGEFFGDDLLPMPQGEGEDKDNNQNRPQIFMPLSRQQYKQLYSFLKLTLFPNDEDFFRIRGEDVTSAIVEDDLTEGIKYLFRQCRISEKLSGFLSDLIIFGNGVAWPTFTVETNWSWSIDPLAQQYVPQLSQSRTLNVEIWNPLHFYPDPFAKDPEKGAWGYFTYRKLQEILDTPGYINKNALSNLATEENRESQEEDSNSLSYFNELNSTMEGIDKNIKLDQYYFPYLKTREREYRNILISIAGESVLAELRPNLSPKGLNPVEFCGWNPDKESPYGTGPMEDIQELQRLINILQNYKIETMARIGNRFIVAEGTDLTNFWGLAAGVGVAPEGVPVSQAIMPIGGNYNEIASLDNSIGVLKAEAQMLSGSQDPFQGSSNIDFQKTATEIKLLQQNSISVIREVVEHVSVSLERILTRLMMLSADLYMDPITIRVDDPLQGTTYRTIDLSLLKQGNFVVELLGSNPAQSQDAQVNLWTQFLQMVLHNPSGVLMCEPILKKIAVLQGEKDFESIMDQLRERITASQTGGVNPINSGPFNGGQTDAGPINPESIQATQIPNGQTINGQNFPPGQPGIPGSPTGMAAPSQPGMEGITVATPPPEGGNGSPTEYF